MDISAIEFDSRRKDPEAFIIIDVREPLEYKTFNLGGDNIPLGILLKEAGELDYEKDSEIIVICQRGLRSKTAATALSAHGFTGVRNLTGGLLSWRKLNK